MPNLKMMFVGDDWQAINRFAGADVNLFLELNKSRNNTTIYSLNRNYRSRKDIVMAGNLLMKNQASECPKAMKLKAAKIQSTDLDDVWLEFRPEDQYMLSRKNDKSFSGEQALKKS